VELMKGSLNTFLNAFTYPDRTCYPVASTNKQVGCACSMGGFLLLSVPLMHLPRSHLLPGRLHQQAGRLCLFVSVRHGHLDTCIPVRTFQAEVFSAAQSKGYLWVLSLESASWGAHTLGTFLKQPLFSHPLTASGVF